MPADEPPTPTAGQEAALGPIPPETAYWGALALSGLLLVVAGATEVLPWPVSLLGLAALGSTRIPGGHWLALGGGVLFAGMVLMVYLSGVGRNHLVERAAADQSGTLPQAVTSAESLGLTVGEVAERWNALGRPPAITGGLIKETETGRYDSFRYRFDGAAIVAGAYDPVDDSVHALMASVGLFHDSAPHYYLHLCFMLHPYSQECIDAYLEDGLAGRQLADYAGAEHRAQWEMGDQLWKLEISGDVQIVRVLSKSAR